MAINQSGRMNRGYKQANNCRKAEVNAPEMSIIIPHYTGKLCAHYTKCMLVSKLNIVVYHDTQSASVEEGKLA